MKDSKITLLTGEIEISQSQLTLIGPKAADGSVTVSGGGNSRVFKHAGSGTLAIESLTISNGYAHGAGNMYGGCIEGTVNGNGVYLYQSVVTGCRVVSDSGYARGGAIHAGDVFVAFSEVSGNRASAPAKRAFGGGIQANQLFGNYGSIHHNVADDGQIGGSIGGGAYALGGMSLFSSTLDHNEASYGGALVSRGASLLVNSTISDNSASIFSGAWYARTGPVSIWNSTIAFNHGDTDTQYAAVAFRGADSASTLDLRSSILANNTAGANQTPADLFIVPGLGTLTGLSSLVMASNSSDPSVIVSTDDPKLGSLQSNGGPTKTRLLSVDSPARDAGDDGGNPHDQRGRGYPRSAGSTTDIGAVQFDEIFPGPFD